MNLESMDFKLRRGNTADMVNIGQKTYFDFLVSYEICAYSAHFGERITEIGRKLLKPQLD